MIRAKWQADDGYDFDRLWIERTAARQEMARRTVEEHLEEWVRWIIPDARKASVP